MHSRLHSTPLNICLYPPSLPINILTQTQSVKLLIDQKLGPLKPATVPNLMTDHANSAPVCPLRPITRAENAGRSISTPTVFQSTGKSSRLHSLSDICTQYSLTNRQYHQSPVIATILLLRCFERIDLLASSESHMQ